MAKNSWNVTIDKEPCDRLHVYATINIAAMENASRVLGASGAFILWIYLAKNQDGYSFDLSKVAVENEFGMKKDKYYTAVKALETHGFLEEVSKDRYVFHEVPLAEKPTLSKNKSENPPKSSLEEKPKVDLLSENPPKIGDLVENSIGGFSDSQIKLSEKPTPILEQTVGKSANKSSVKSSIGGKTDSELSENPPKLSGKSITLSENPYRNITDNTILQDNITETTTAPMKKKATFKADDGKEFVF